MLARSLSGLVATACHHGCGALSWKGRLTAAFPFAWLEAEIGYELSVLVLDHIRTLNALQRSLGTLIAERCGLFVVGLGGRGILRAASSALGEGSHALQRTGVILLRRLLEPGPRGVFILPAAHAVCIHYSKLVLRFRRVRFRCFRQQRPRLAGVWSTTTQRRQIGDTARVAGLGSALEKPARLGLIFGSTGTGAEKHA